MIWFLKYEFNNKLLESIMLLKVTLFYFIILLKLSLGMVFRLINNNKSNCKEKTHAI